MAARQPFVAPGRFLTILVLCSVLSIIIFLNVVWLQPALYGLLDFGSFIAAGQEAAAGENPYRADSPLVHTVESSDGSQRLPALNLNPPVSVLFFRGLAQMEPLRAVSGWRLISAFLFAGGIVALGWHYRRFTNPVRIVWALCLAGIWNTLALGQIYAPLFLATIGAWVLMEKRRCLLAGILLGFLVAIKPNFIFWLILLAVAGQARTVLSAMGTILTLSLLPMLVMGTEVYHQWLDALLNHPSLGLWIAGNSSLQSLAARLGEARLGIVLSFLLAGAVLAYLYRRRASPDLHVINSVGIISSILISPFSWPGYTALTLPILFARPDWSWLEKAAAACLVFPYLLVLYFFQGSTFHSVLFGWLYGWGLLFLLAGTVFRSPNRQPERYPAENP